MSWIVVRLIAFAGGVALLLGSGYLRFRGLGGLAWVATAAGIVLVAIGIARIYRSQPKDDPFRRFAGGAFLADPRSPLFCTCGHDCGITRFVRTHSNARDAMRKGLRVRAR